MGAPSLRTHPSDSSSRGRQNDGAYGCALLLKHEKPGHWAGLFSLPPV